MENSKMSYFAHSACSIGGVETFSGTFRNLTLSDIGMPYDFSGQVLNTSGNYYELNNPCYNTIGVHVHTYSGMSINFLGSFDGISFSPLTLRQIGDDGYTKNAPYSSYNETGGYDEYIGSISSIRKIRFMVDSTGSDGPAIIMGRMSVPVSTLEGIENNSAPHKFGHQPFHKGIFINNTTGNNILIYQPPTGTNFVVTDLNLSIYSNGANITIYEGINLNNVNNWIYSLYVKTTSQDTQLVNMNFSTPFVASGTNNPLNISADATSTVRGVINGYYFRP